MNALLTELTDMSYHAFVEARYVPALMLKNRANPGVHIVELKVYPTENNRTK